MELFMSTQLAIPMFQVILLLILSTIALLIGRLRLALFITSLKKNFPSFFSAGIVIVLLAMIGLILHRE